MLRVKRCCRRRRHKTGDGCSPFSSSMSLLKENVVSAPLSLLTLTSPSRLSSRLVSPWRNVSQSTPHSQVFILFQMKCRETSYQIQFSSVHLLSRVWLFVTPWTAARQASLSIANSRSLLKLMSIELVMPSKHLILCHPLLLPPSIFPSIRVFSNESIHQVTKVLEFQLQHQSFQWTFRIDFLQDGLAGSPCSPRDPQEYHPIPQFKSINSSVLSFLYSPTFTHDYWKKDSFD